MGEVNAAGQYPYVAGHDRAAGDRSRRRLHAARRQLHRVQVTRSIDGARRDRAAQPQRSGPAGRHALCPRAALLSDADRRWRAVAAALGSGMTETSRSHRPLLPRAGRRPLPPRPRPRRGAAPRRPCGRHHLRFVDRRRLRGGAPRARSQPSLALGLRRIPMRRQIAPSDIAATWRLLREVRSLDPDILHAHGAKGGAYARTIGTLLRASGSRVARIYSPHGGSLHYDPKSASRPRLFRRRARARADDRRLHLRQPVRGRRLRREGRQAAAGRRSSSATASGRRSSSRSSRRPTRATSSSSAMLRDLKGPDVFIEALARDRATQRATRRARSIVGAGDGQAALRGAWSRELGLGRRGRLPRPDAGARGLRAWRARSSCRRARSRCPTSCSRRSRAGVPMVATNVGGIPEIFGAEPRTGWCRPATPSALADAMMAPRAPRRRRRGRTRTRLQGAHPRRSSRSRRWRRSIEACLSRA